jgi:hypothetical protein
MNHHLQRKYYHLQRTHHLQWNRHLQRNYYHLQRAHNLQWNC